MKFYVIAGEASGDLHGANLIKALKQKFPQAKFRCWGGDKMQEEGAELVKHYRHLAFMGFKEVIANIGTILNNIKFCKKDIENYKPDAIIFIDYPGFNLRIAKWAKQQEFKTIYYISPQLWAWKEGRIKQIKQNIDKMIVILPFEKDFYGKYNYEVDYVGHPLLDVIQDFKPDPDFHSKYNLSQKPIIALLPGSRKQEIERMLSVMLKVAGKFKDYQFVVAGAPGQEKEFYLPFLESYPNVKIIFNNTYNIYAHAVAALVTSGTATLETALFGVPEVVCYKGSFLSYEIGKRLVHVKYISLVNLIMDAPVVKELIQHNFTELNVTEELEKLLHNVIYRNEMIGNMQKLRIKLGGSGASAKAATAIEIFLAKA